MAKISEDIEFDFAKKEIILNRTVTRNEVTTAMIRAAERSFYTPVLPPLMPRSVLNDTSLIWLENKE